MPPYQPQSTWESWACLRKKPSSTGRPCGNGERRLRSGLIGPGRWLFVAATRAPDMASRTRFGLPDLPRASRSPGHRRVVHQRGHRADQPLRARRVETRRPGIPGGRHKTTVRCAPIIALGLIIAQHGRVRPGSLPDHCSSPPPRRCCPGKPSAGCCPHCSRWRHTSARYAR